MFSTTQSWTAIIKIIYKIMKNLLFGLMATVLFAFNGNAQEIDFKTFTTKNQVTVKSDEVIFQTFFLKNEDYLKEFIYSDLITLNKLNQENISIYDLLLLKNDKFNHLYVVYNDLDKTFQTFLAKTDDSVIKIYNNNGEDLFIISNVKDKAVFTITSAEKRSCFGKCMDAAEDTMTDDFVGWVAWHHPGVQLAVAIHCAAKCG